MAPAFDATAARYCVVPSAQKRHPVVNQRVHLKHDPSYWLRCGTSQLRIGANGRGDTAKDVASHGSKSFTMI